MSYNDWLDFKLDPQTVDILLPALDAYEDYLERRKDEAKLTAGHLLGSLQRWEKRHTLPPAAKTDGDS